MPASFAAATFLDKPVRVTYMVHSRESAPHERSFLRSCLPPSPQQSPQLRRVVSVELGGKMRPRLSLRLRLRWFVIDLSVVAMTDSGGRKLRLYFWFGLGAIALIIAMRVDISIVSPSSPYPFGRSIIVLEIC